MTSDYTNLTESMTTSWPDLSNETAMSYVPPAGFMVTCKLVAVLLSVSIVINVIGNISAITVFITDRTVRTQQGIYILNLSVTDLTLGVLVLPTYTTYIWRGMWLLVPHSYCLFVRIIDIITSTESCLSVMLISYDRLQMLRHGAAYNTKVTVKHTIMSIMFSWLVSITLFTPSMASFQPPIPHMCLSDFPQDPYMTTMFAIPCILVPAIWIAGCYLISFIMLNRRISKRVGAKAQESLGTGTTSAQVTGNQGTSESASNKTGNVMPTHDDSSLSHAEGSAESNSINKAKNPKLKSKETADRRVLRAARFMGTLLGAFVLCWGPSSSIIFLRFVTKIQVSPVWILVFAWLFWFNSSLNPILYAATNRQYRSRLHKILSRVTGRPT